MGERQAAELARIVEELGKDSGTIGSAELAHLAEHLANVFSVRPDEVAIFALTDQKFLKFLLPEKLQAVGTIPLTSTTALAARTAREKRPELINKFTTAPHASVFEGVPLGRRHGEAIHKIMSAPIALEGKVVGVVQISRKGHTPSEAGPDFTQKELRELVSLSGALARFVKLCQAS